MSRTVATGSTGSSASRENSQFFFSYWWPLSVFSPTSSAPVFGRQNGRERGLGAGRDKVRHRFWSKWDKPGQTISQRGDREKSQLGEMVGLTTSTDPKEVPLMPVRPPAVPVETFDRLVGEPARPRTVPPIQGEGEFDGTV